MFQPCVVIPVYNHEHAIGGVLAQVLAHGLPVILVDDGCSAACAAVLDGLAAAHPARVVLERHAVNQGKGGAVLTGFARAARDGYTHVLQVDADGQHSVSDVPRFLAESEKAPEAMICGRPIYDHSVPRARLYGRYVTHALVWVETLSFAIADSMCGYRLYPLAATCAEIERKPLPARMDFDTEIAVRLYWRGVPVRNLATRVIYPDNGLSHFRMWRDNLRISAMHTRLLLGMLPRAPRLLLRKRRA